MLALTIDHVMGGGGRERAKTRYWNFYKWLARRGFPDGYQVLCMNCQMIKKIVNNEIKSDLRARESIRLHPSSTEARKVAEVTQTS
jgi:hypothetical protein